MYCRCRRLIIAHQRNGNDMRTKIWLGHNKQPLNANNDGGIVVLKSRGKRKRKASRVTPAHQPYPSRFAVLPGSSWYDKMLTVHRLREDTPGDVSTKKDKRRPLTTRCSGKNSQIFLVGLCQIAKNGTRSGWTRMHGCSPSTGQRCAL